MPTERDSAAGRCGWKGARREPSQIIERNERFLGYAQNSLNMLKRLDKSPEDLQGLIIEFIAEAKKMRAEQPDFAKAAIDELVQRFLDTGLKSIKNKSY